ncbi:MAG TPA: hypothetical protein VMF03_19125 [Steroidobacteraceae bacterium]|nr:hypothetical protein [Steroidobacteraceae bacterium]
MNLSDAKARAEHRRRTIVLHRTVLKDVESDLNPLAGPAAVSLVERLTRESWAAAGKSIPTYPRQKIPVRFVPEGPK